MRETGEIQTQGFIVIRHNQAYIYSRKKSCYIPLSPIFLTWISKQPIGFMVQLGLANRDKYMFSLFIIRFLYKKENISKGKNSMSKKKELMAKIRRFKLE